MILHAGLVVALDPYVGSGMVGVAVHDPHVAEHVAEFVDLGCIGAERLLHVGDGLEDLVVDVDPMGGPPSQFRVVGGHDGYRLALVSNPFRGEHRLVGELQAIRRLPRNVPGQQHRVDAG